MTNQPARPEAGAEEIPIVLDGDEMTLRPTFGAARTISNRYGGTAKAIERVLNLDIDAVSEILTVGLGYTQTRKPPKDLHEKIWKTGLTDDTGGLAERCVLFLRALASGGRVPSDEEPEEEEEEAAPADPR